jgi:hypothetical protein
MIQVIRKIQKNEKFMKMKIIINEEIYKDIDIAIMKIIAIVKNLQFYPK